MVQPRVKAINLAWLGVTAKFGCMLRGHGKNCGIVRGHSKDLGHGEGYGKNVWHGKCMKNSKV